MGTQLEKTYVIPADWHKDSDRAVKITGARSVSTVPAHILKFRDKLEFFSPKKLADQLGASVWFIYDEIKAGNLNCQHLGRLIRISSFDVADYLESQNGQRG